MTCSPTVIPNTFDYIILLFFFITYDRCQELTVQEKLQSLISYVAMMWSFIPSAMSFEQLFLAVNYFIKLSNNKLL